MKVELIYFDLQGRATQARVMLKMAGIEFTDTRLTKEEFGEKKPSFEESALGQLPVLKVDDKAKDFKLCPTSSLCFSYRTWCTSITMTTVVSNTTVFLILEKFTARVMQSWSGLLIKLD